MVPDAAWVGDLLVAPVGGGAAVAAEAGDSAAVKLQHHGVGYCLIPVLVGVVFVPGELQTPPRPNMEIEWNPPHDH